MSVTPEIFIKKNGFAAFHRIFDQPRVYGKFIGGKPFEAYGIVFDQYSLGLSLLSAVRIPHRFFREKKQIIRDTGTDQHLLCFVYQAVRNGAYEKERKKIHLSHNQREVSNWDKNNNILGLLVFASLNTMDIAKTYHESDWIQSVRIRKVLRSYVPYLAKPMRRVIDLRHPQLGKDAWLGKVARKKTRVANALRKLRKGTDFKTVVRNNPLTKEQFSKLLYYARRFGFDTQGVLTEYEKRDKLFADLEKAGSFADIVKLLNQVSATYLVKDSKGYPHIVCLSDLIEKIGIDARKIRTKKYDQIEKYLLKKHLAVTHKEKKLKIKPNGNNRQGIRFQRYYYLRRRDSARAIKFLRKYFNN